MNPYLKGLTQEILLTSSKDGFLKLWDLNQQSCIHSFTEDLSPKITSFEIIEDLKMIVVGNDDSSHLKVYKFYVDEKTYLPALKVAGKIKKHSEGTVIHMNYQNKKLLVI